MYQIFRQDNTEGYTDAQLDALNAEFTQRFNAGDWEEVDYDEAVKIFQDEVSRR